MPFMGLPGIVGQKGGENKRSGQVCASAGSSACQSAPNIGQQTASRFPVRNDYPIDL